MMEIGHYEDLERLKRKVDHLSAEYERASSVVPKEQFFKQLQAAKETLWTKIEQRIDEEQQEWKKCQ